MVAQIPQFADKAEAMLIDWSADVEVPGGSAAASQLQEPIHGGTLSIRRWTAAA